MQRSLAVAEALEPWPPRRVHADPERVPASSARSLASTHGGADTKRRTQRASVRSVLLGCTRLAKASQEHQPGRRPDPCETPVGTTTVAPAAASTSSVPTTMTPPPSGSGTTPRVPGEPAGIAQLR